MIGLTRRALLGLAAAGAAYIARPSLAREMLLPRLIEEARVYPSISERIAHISHALLGAPYIIDPLGGGPHEKERLTLREDGFDCVTFCETVLAAARSRTPDAFAFELRKLRYRDGNVDWFARNHYFVEWGINNVANGRCRALVLPGAERVRKTLDYMQALPATRVGFEAIPRGSLFAHADRLATGDIVAFVSRRAGIDVFHTGLLIAEGGELRMRHCARSRGRVLEQPLARFLASSGALKVVLWRPCETIADDLIA
jgi:hypothetical protein